MANAPGLEALYQTYKDEGLIIVTLMVDSSVSMTDLGAWADAYGLTFPVMHDDWSLASAWEIPGTPAQHLIGRGGEILELNTRVSDSLLEEVLGL